MGTIAFSDIFSRAIGVFDDPDISLAYFNDPAKFAKIMRPFLINGKGRFSNPTILSDQLSVYSAATGETEMGQRTVEEAQDFLRPPDLPTELMSVWARAQPPPPGCGFSAWDAGVG